MFLDGSAEDVYFTSLHFVWEIDIILVDSEIWTTN